MFLSCPPGSENLAMALGYRIFIKTLLGKSWGLQVKGSDTIYDAKNADTVNGRQQLGGSDAYV